MSQEVRIIGGQYRGKKISFPNAKILRPTPDRVRETLFNWLMHDIRNARCLDAFAGSGALGLEAFSRGAKEVIFIEENKSIFLHLQKTIASFNCSQLRVIHGSALAFINSFQQFDIKAQTVDDLESATFPFDIIFLDPPFHSTLLSSCLNQFTQTQLSADTLIYIESGPDFVLDTHSWQVIKHKKAGAVYYRLIKRIIS